MSGELIRLPSLELRPEYEETFNHLTRVRKDGGAEAFRAALRKIVEEDLYLFSYLIGYDVPAHRWSPMHLWAARQLIPELLGIPGAMILWHQPRGTHKTAEISEAMLTQYICKHPDLSNGVGSWKGPVATNIHLQVRKNLCHPILFWLFPEVLWANNANQSPRWTDEHICVKGNDAKDATLTRFSAESPPVSLHFSGLCICDDIVDRRNTRTAYLIEQVKKTMQDARNWLGSLDAQLWVVGTPWDEEDWYAELAQNPNVIKVRFPAIAEDSTDFPDAAPLPSPFPTLEIKPGEAVFPTVKPLATLELDKATMASCHFEAQLQCRLSATGSHTWTKEQVNKYWHTLPYPYKAFGFVDLAKDKPNAKDDGRKCETAAGVWLTGPGSFFKLYSVDGIADQIAPTDLAYWLYDRQEEWDCFWWIEEIGLASYFESVLQHVRKEKGYALNHTVITDRHEESKNDRVLGCDSFFRAGRLLIPDPRTITNPAYKNFIESYIHQFIRHPRSVQRDIQDITADACKFCQPAATDYPRNRREAAVQMEQQADEEGTFYIDKELGV